jgi:cytochrome c
LETRNVRALFAAIVAPALLACSLPAAANLELAQKYSCMACHAPDRKVVGPAYQDVAKKYGSDAEAVNKLVASIRNGGAGRWGPIPMPAQPNLSEADAKKLAEWVLAGAK